MREANENRQNTFARCQQLQQDVLRLKQRVKQLVDAKNVSVEENSEFKRQIQELNEAQRTSSGQLAEARLLLSNAEDNCARLEEVRWWLSFAGLCG